MKSELIPAIDNFGNSYMGCPTHRILSLAEIEARCRGSSMNDHEVVQAYATACGAADDYIKALEEEMGHQGVGGGQEMNALRKKWEDAKTGIHKAHQA